MYDTPCNATYGCCGCDDCVGQFEDISHRLDRFAYLDELIGWPKKTHWKAPQALEPETYWTRYPTADEEVVMTMLSINHAAKGIVMWDFPTSPEILHVTDALASVLTTEPVSHFLLSTPIVQQLSVNGAGRVDAAAWIDQGRILVSVVNLNAHDLDGVIAIHLPSTHGPVKSVEISTLWGEVEWHVAGHGKELWTRGLPGLGFSLLVLNL